MPGKRGEADRREAFREMLTARDAVVLPADFDRRFAEWEAGRRIRISLFAAGLVLVLLAAGVALALYLRHLDFLNHFACFDGGGSWVGGRCRLPS
jgi:hypothetical protein